MLKSLGTFIMPGTHRQALSVWKPVTFSETRRTVAWTDLKLAV
ncbi:rCG36780 [Rattus norvegicus]|uniref:RCG36780 n=1 Tax=Rattus norvegicus TaxID=10116 RepID=A6JSB2_RAT|nr:rCG36780 [Rattus norvegicus]